VNLDFAPVLDTVPSPAAARHNPPIGVFQREFGFTTQRVTRQGLAFAAGLQSARVAPTVKHFPGLGRVTANTDTTAHVTDGRTTGTDVYLRPFAAAVQAGVPYVMVSTAVYSRIDARHPAAFSRRIVTGLLRQQLGFDGVVVSDDLGQAKQVLAWSPAARAVDFVRAGGDLVLTVTPATLPAMANGLLTAYRTDPAFAKLVDAAVLRVLAQKQRQHLLQLP
jgi:beta-N-acetylhexosaminidase